MAIEGGVLKIAPMKADTPDGAQTLGAAAYDVLPRIKITDMPLEVDDWTRFTRQRSGLPSEGRTRQGRSVDLWFGMSRPSVGPT